MPNLQNIFVSFDSGARIIITMAQNHIHEKEKNRKPCISFFMVNMGGDMDRWCLL